MQVVNSVLDLIGRTPMVKGLNQRPHWYVYD